MNNAELLELAARNQREANARLAAAGRCYLNRTHPATHLLTLPIGNVVPLCTPCLDWWKTSAEEETGDPMSRPVRITDLPAAHHIA